METENITKNIKKIKSTTVMSLCLAIAIFIGGYYLGQHQNTAYIPPSVHCVKALDAVGELNLNEVMSRASKGEQFMPNLGRFAEEAKLCRTAPSSVKAELYDSTSTTGAVK